MMCLVAVSVAIPTCLFLIQVERSDDLDTNSGACVNVVILLRLLFVLLGLVDMALMPMWGEQTIATKAQRFVFVLFKGYAGMHFNIIVGLVVYAMNHHLNRSSSAGSMYE